MDTVAVATAATEERVKLILLQSTRLHLHNPRLNNFLMVTPAIIYGKAIRTFGISSIVMSA